MPFFAGFRIGFDNNYIYVSLIGIWLGIHKYALDGNLENNWLLDRPPGGIAFDSNGYIYITVGNGIHKYNSDGESQGWFGKDAQGETGWHDPGSTTLAKPGSEDGAFSVPSDLIFDIQDNMYVLDDGNNRVQKFGSSGTFLEKWGKSGSGIGEFYNPMGITLYNNTVYVADSGNDRIQRFVPYYKVKLTWEESEINNIDPGTCEIYSDIIKTYNDVPDSPYLTFHMYNGVDFTHKRINSKQLTSLVPFIDEFNSEDSLKKQGTYTKVPSGASSHWEVNSLGVLKSTAGFADILIIPQKYPTWRDYDFTAYIKKKNESAVPLNFSLLYKVTDLDNYYEFNLNENGGSLETVHYNVTPISSNIIPNSEKNSIDISQFDDFVPVRIEVRNHESSGKTKITTYINEQEKNKFIYNMPLYGGVGIKANNTEIEVDKLEIKPLR